MLKPVFKRVGSTSQTWLPHTARPLHGEAVAKGSGALGHPGPHEDLSPPKNKDNISLEKVSCLSVTQFPFIHGFLDGVILRNLVLSAVPMPAPTHLESPSVKKKLGDVKQ